jgi:PadR family transcriptional regulator, regulatory protein AphA
MKNENTTKINKIHYIILGFLMDQPMNGYQIKKCMEISTFHFLKASYGNIYPSLKSLVIEGLLEESENLTTKRKNASVYSITSNGIKLFIDWLKHDKADHHYGNNHLLELFFLRHLSESDKIDRINRNINVFEEEINKLKMLKQEIIGLADDYQLMTLEYGLITYAEKIEFYKNIRKEMK